MQVASKVDLPMGSRYKELQGVREQHHEGQAMPWGPGACWVSWKVCALVAIPGLELCLCHLLAVRLGLEEPVSHIGSLFLTFKAVSPSL